MNTPTLVITRTREEVIERWVAALRSGKYEQAHEVLNDGVGFCCLGVLCDLAAKDGGPQWDRDHYFMGEETELPQEMALWIDPKHGLAGPKSILHDLARKNDAGSTFVELANIIERDLL